MSRATSFASMAQQLSLSVGAGTGALLLHLTAAGEGTLRGSDFTMAFMIVGAISALSILSFVRLPVDAGADMTGRLPQRRPE